MRHKVYDSIVQRLTDYGWHDASELNELTPYPELWLESLRRDRKFEVRRFEESAAAAARRGDKSGLSSVTAVPMVTYG